MATVNIDVLGSSTVAVAHFPPFLFIVIRQLIAGSIMVGFMVTVGKAKWPSRQEVFKQVAWAEVHITLAPVLTPTCRGSLVPNHAVSLLTDPFNQNHLDHLKRY